MGAQRGVLPDFPSSAFGTGGPRPFPRRDRALGNAAYLLQLLGGDLKGVVQKLDHLTELGANAIYLTPIFEATSNHKYDTIDYTRIDPHFGDESTLVELVQQAHRRGIRIMLDGVFNHCGFYFRQFQDVLRHGEALPTRTGSTSIPSLSRWIPPILTGLA